VKVHIVHLPLTYVDEATWCRCNGEK
jgi:hypothetical protein